MEHPLLVKRAIQAIREAHSDTTVAAEVTLERLEVIAEEVDCLVSVVKDEIAEAERPG